ncbi:hypothetical protein J3B02_005287 [Coemansia erecta]|uniref:Serine aminopeptidase S33 domain-containing protein n=1 Tax=Coemansia asiatica TaxID=1052880 RepID=A0A9W7XK30_9FUNG|nr:hypothetical protein LPJ64_002145 [Coemansia asiatica]KAJ2843374.1 hypothetical protein J3B02_005287 [Coemansia erecta]KAJ2884827.1 hypothetical protein FB639_001892 [Coemansia asiatica]
MSTAAETIEEPKTIVKDGVKEVIEWVENDGRSFYIHRFMPQDKAPVATLTIVHGLGEHIDRYEDLARGFVQSGIEVLGFDQRGFGKTGRRCGRLGDNEGIDCVACDISFMNKQVAKPDIPHFLFGHSMGGLNVLNYTLNHNEDGHVRGVIASAPALKAGKPLLPPNFVITALHQVAKVFPSIQKNTGITVDMLTSNQSEIEKFNASVENISHCTLGTLSNIIKRGETVIKNAARFSTPVYLVHADGDKATDVQGTRAFYEALPDSVDKQFREVKDNKYHELHFEEDLDFELLDSYIQWILSRI